MDRGKTEHSNTQSGVPDGEREGGHAKQPIARPRRWNGWFKLLAVGSAMCIALVCSDIALRFLVNVTDVAFMIWDPLIGPRRAPNQSGTFYVGLEAHGRYTINAHGWNNIHRTYSAVKKAGARRVCLIGDSMVEAMHVNVEDSMASVAERAMSRPDRPVDWYTFANSGFGTTHEYLLIHHYALDYRPDVVVMLFIANDPVDCSVYLAPQEPWMARMLLGDSDDLVYVAPEQYVPSTMKRVFAKSALVRYLFIQKRLFEGQAARLAPGQMPVREQTMATLVASSSKADTLDERVARTWELIERVLKQTKQECNARGAEFLLVYQGHRFEMEAAAERQTYKSPPREVDPLCIWERLNEMGRDYLEPVARRQGIHYLDLTEAISEACRSSRARFNFVDDGHFNTFGHRVAGEAMAAKVEEILVGERGRP